MSIVLKKSDIIFSSFAGNEHVKQQLAEDIKTGRLSHAVVLQGEKGTGKKTLAHLLAKTLVCRNEDTKPCGKCPPCIRAAAGSHPDIRVIEGTGKTKNISVDAVKDLTVDAYRMPEEAEASIYLLFAENRLSEAVQNKLLKIIEEPPENTLFIFTCNSAEELLNTIRSRVRIFTLRSPDTKQAADFVFSHFDIDRQKAEELAEICGGNIGQMLEEQENTDGGAREISRKISESLVSGKEHDLLQATATLIRNRKQFEDVLSKLHFIFRDAYMLRVAGEKDIALLSGEKASAQVLCRFSLKRLMQLSQIPQKYRQLLERNINMTLLVTSFCMELRTALNG
jgi:DNA polymerase III, gamma/tau subunits